MTRHKIVFAILQRIHTTNGRSSNNIILQPSLFPELKPLTLLKTWFLNKVLYILSKCRITTDAQYTHTRTHSRHYTCKIWNGYIICIICEYNPYTLSMWNTHMHVSVYHVCIILILAYERVELSFAQHFWYNAS